jgi:hypothetical protein
MAIYLGWYGAPFGDGTFLGVEFNTYMAIHIKVKFIHMAIYLGWYGGHHLEMAHYLV